MKKLGEFCIPLHKSELLNDKRNDSFSLFEICSSDFPNLLNDFEEELGQRGPIAVVDNFSVAFASINKYPNADNSSRFRIFKKLASVFQTQIKLTADLLDENVSDLQEKQNHRNCIKILSFLLCGIIDEIQVPTKPAVGRSKGRPSNRTKGKKVAVKPANDYSSGIDPALMALVEKYLDLLIQLFSIPIHMLWQPPILEDEYLRLITNFCFKLFEDVGGSRNKCTFRLVSQLIGTILSKHNSLLSITLKILKVVQHIENQSIPMSLLVNTIVTEFKCPQIIVNIFKELSQSHSTDMVNDSASSRNCAQFISSLGQLCAKEVLSNCSLLMCHLEWDPYSLRNAVLDCFGHIIVQIFSKPDLDGVSRKSRDIFLDKIEEHLCDINAYVRSHVLQILTAICKEKAIPLSRFNQITSLTIKRLHDKSCNVRKNAAFLLHQLLLCNPYSLNLSIDALKTELSVQEKKYGLNACEDRTSSIVNNSATVWSTIESGLKIFLEGFDLSSLEDSDLSCHEKSTSNENRSSIIDHLSNYKFKKALVLLKNNISTYPESLAPKCSSFSSLTDDNIVGIIKKIYFEHVSGLLLENNKAINESEVVDEETKLNIATMNYFKDSLTFSKQVYDALPIVYRLLNSETQSDVLEIVNLLVSVCKFSIASFVEILDHILPIIWSNEASLRNGLTDAIFKLIFENSSISQIIRKMFISIKDAPIGRLSAIEELMFQLAHKQLVPKQIIKKLWELFSEGTDFSDKTLSITLLSMLAKGDPDILSDNIEAVALYGFNKEGATDIKLAIACCNTITKHTINVRKNGEDILRNKYPSNNVILKQLFTLLLSTFCDTKLTSWSILCESAMRVIVYLCDRPFNVLSKILKELLSLCPFIYSEKSELQKSEYVCLVRLLHAIGFTATSILFLLEGDFLAEIKRRSQILQRPPSSEPSNKKKSISLNSSIQNALDSNDEDLNIVGPTADDNEIEFVKDLCENELLHESNFLFKFIPLLTYIVENNTKINDMVVSAGVLAFAKFMLLSSSFCAKNLQLIFSLLQRPCHENIKLNLIIIIGDIIQRFPNIVEPWMPNYFSLLRDNSIMVRKSALSVLSSLVLNDMVKVKGHIIDLVVCIEDKDSSISARTRLFFKELALKDNAIYNIIPDVISRLSESKSSLDSNLFEKVMKFLLKFLQKERQCESLVEKLCHRFTLCRTVSEVNDIVFCLSQLNIGERSFKKLIDCYPTYKDRVFDDRVYEGFTSIISKFKKNAREELKILIEEFEERLFNSHTRGLKDDDLKDTSTTIFKTPTKESLVFDLKTPKQKSTRIRKKDFQTPLGKSSIETSIVNKRGRKAKKIMQVSSGSEVEKPEKIAPII